MLERLVQEEEGQRHDQRTKKSDLLLHAVFFHNLLELAHSRSSLHREHSRLSHGINLGHRKAIQCGTERHGVDCVMKLFVSRGCQNL